MNKGRRAGRRLRGVILVLGIVFTAAGPAWMLLPFFNEWLDTGFMGLMGTPLAPMVFDSEAAYAINVVAVVGLLLLGQWAFLRPGRAWTARLAETGRPLKSAVISAAAMAMLLSVGLIAMVLEVPNWWEPIMDDGLFGVAGIFTGMGLLWALWAGVFLVYWRQGDRYTQLGKMVRGLVAGSLLEATVAVPAHVWAMQERDCYCVRGTHTALTMSGAVLLWAFGPGVVLLYMRKHYRRARIFPRCTGCGYSLIGNESGVCPECGKRA